MPWACGTVAHAWTQQRRQTKSRRPGNCTGMSVCVQLRTMVPTVQPPPPTKNSNAAPDTKASQASLAGTVHKLHDLIFKIAIPKSKTTKMTSIAVDMLLLAHELAESTCTQLQGHREVPRVDNISRQLDNIKAYLGISSAAQLPQKPSYAVALTMGTRSVVPAVGPPPPKPQPRPHVSG